MISNFAFTTILGFPLIMYGGIFTFLCLITTATMGFLIFKGYRIPLKAHKTFATTTVILAIIHGFFGLAFFFKF